MLDRWTIGATAVVAVVAVVLNAIGARRATPGMRILCAMRAALAAVYVGWYVWLLMFPADRAGWSRSIAGVNLVAWVVVWISPAWYVLRSRRPPSGIERRR